MLSYHTVRAAPAENNNPVFSTRSTPDDLADTDTVIRRRARWQGDRHLCGYRCELRRHSYLHVDTGDAELLSTIDIEDRSGHCGSSSGLRRGDPAQATASPSMHLTRPARPDYYIDLTVTTTNVNEAPTVTGGEAMGTIPGDRQHSGRPLMTTTSPLCRPPLSPAADQDADDDNENLTATLGGDDGRPVRISPFREHGCA